MRPELAEQIAAQEPFFAPVITVPEGVDLVEDELDGVPVEWTIPAGGPRDEGLVIIYLHGTAIARIRSSTSEEDARQ